MGDGLSNLFSDPPAFSNAARHVACGKFHCVPTRDWDLKQQNNNNQPTRQTKPFSSIKNTFDSERSRKGEKHPYGTWSTLWEPVLWRYSWVTPGGPGVCRSGTAVPKTGCLCHLALPGCCTGPLKHVHRLSALHQGNYQQVQRTLLSAISGDGISCSPKSVHSHEHWMCLFRRYKN